MANLQIFFGTPLLLVLAAGGHLPSVWRGRVHRRRATDDDGQRFYSYLGNLHAH